MIWSSYSVVVISMNGFYRSQTLHHGSMNDHELSLAIYVPVKIFQGSHVSTKIFYLELYYQRIIFCQIISELQYIIYIYV